MSDILMWVILPLCAVAEIILMVRSIRLQSHFSKLQKRFDEIGVEKAKLRKQAAALANPDDRRSIINPPAGRMTPPDLSADGLVECGDCTWYGRYCCTLDTSFGTKAQCDSKECNANRRRKAPEETKNGRTTH